MLRPLRRHHERHEQHHVLVARIWRHASDLRALWHHVRVSADPAYLDVSRRLRVWTHGVGPVVRVIWKKRDDGVFIRHPHGFLDRVGSCAEFWGAGGV